MSYAYFHIMVIMGQSGSHNEVCNGKNIAQCGDKCQEQNQNNSLNCGQTRVLSYKHLKLRY